MVDASPTGLELDVPAPVKFEEVELAYDMNRHALSLEAKQLGKRLPDC
jgi:hypothetical protein